MHYTLRDRITDWLADQLDWFVPAVIAVSLFVVIISAMVSIALYTDQASCRGQSEAMGVSWSWGAWRGCMIVVDGKNIPLSAYKVVKIAP